MHLILAISMIAICAVVGYNIVIKYVADQYAGYKWLGWKFYPLPFGEGYFCIKENKWKERDFIL